MNHLKKEISDGRLKFPEKNKAPMKVDEDPFPKVGIHVARANIQPPEGTAGAP